MEVGRVRASAGAGSVVGAANDGCEPVAGSGAIVANDEPPPDQQGSPLTACILIASKDGEATIGVTIANCSDQADVYVVSDGSTDDTVAEAERCGATVMMLADNVGKPQALRDAYFAFALGERYDAILVLATTLASTGTSLSRRCG